MAKQTPETPPVKFCGEKGCGKKMAAFKRGSGWKYVCPDAAKHAEEKLRVKQAKSKRGRGGVKKGTPSPKQGKEYPTKYRTRYDWTKLRKKEGDGK